ncbi:MAG: DUF4861 domain-containing protein [Bacteroides acidifaciens]|uniref:DUF4861 domain-containing protein n=1 Tax=Bacteroides acidifaciens TaxID=85831 RepID=UPI0023D502E7|nr:DUF4861 domain-containing protein [Bacteroides acidifaciens]MDE6822047.1 DUF4861 domain-containing protein [Bacteroides acidifaciens]MDE6987862.1 DUF4861 domain-containing protein [Bacteroides acidifaciens]
MRIIYILCALLVSFSSCQEKAATTIVLQNPINKERVDESFKLSRAELKAASESLVPVVKKLDGTYVPCQVDDIDRDGVWDELAFVYTLKGEEKVELMVEWVSVSDYPVFERRTNIRYGKMTSPGHVEELAFDMHGKHNLPRSVNYPYQMDGPAWENDKIAFRHYFDGRNCRDLFGKRISEMVLDTVGIRADGYPDNTYQVLREWGCDILSAANSFGLGGLALQLPDTLVRMGVESKDTVDIIDSSHFEIITEGPVRSMFRLDFIGWDVLGTKIDVHETVTIWAGKQGHEEDIRISPLPENAVLVTGIVANNNTKEPVEKQYDGKWISMITHDKQTVNKDYELGMALLIPQEQLIETFHTPDTGSGILKTWCAKLKPGEKGYHYQVYAGWELGVDSFSEREDFIRLIDTYADHLNHPVIITIK